MAVPNQKIVYIGDRLPRDSEHPYSEQSIEAMAAAAKKLSGDRFKVWLYLSKNRDDFRLELSQKAVEHEWGVKKDTFQRAVKDMIDLGYLIEIDSEKNEWKFEEMPENPPVQNNTDAEAVFAQVPMKNSKGQWEF